MFFFFKYFFFQAEDGIRDRSPSRGLGDVYKRQNSGRGEKKAAIRRSSWESKRRRGYEGRVMSAGELFFGGLLAVNAAAFFLYGLDKWKAVHGRRRIRERTLLFIAAAGGSAGAFLAMRFFRHKTRHVSFQFGVPVLFLLQAAFAFFLWK